jgi:MFS family permease
MSLQLVLRDRKFRPLFWVQFLGALNDNLLKNAMVVLIEYQGLSLLGLDPPLIVALSGAIFILPFFLFSMLAGQLGDRFEKSRIIRLVKIWELLITILASWGFLTHNIYLLLGALFMMGTHSTFFGPIKYGCLPDLVPGNKLVAANAYIEMGTFIAILLGTIGGGVLIARDSGELWIAFALNVCALFGIWVSQSVVQLPSHGTNTSIGWSPIGPLRESIQIMRKRNDVFYSLVGISWFWFFGAALLSILPPYCKEFLKVDEHVITLFLTMFTMGIGSGSILCERLSFERVVLSYVPLGALGMSVFMVDLCWTQFHAVEIVGTELRTIGEFWNSPGSLRLIFDFFMLSVSGGFFALPLYTLMQARSDKTERSRVVAGNNVMNAIFMVFAAAFVMLAHTTGRSVTETLICLAVINLIATVFLIWKVPEFVQKWRKRPA